MSAVILEFPGTEFLEPINLVKKTYQVYTLREANKYAKQDNCVDVNGPHQGDHGQYFNVVLCEEQ